VTDDTSTRSWNGIADDWVVHADANDYRNHYLMPRMLAMLDQVAGKALLDLGCGEGGYARELARRGARVTAVDGSDSSKWRASVRALRTSTSGSCTPTRMLFTNWNHTGSTSSWRR
jgi:2-polyprenyl-3-methyl-5-hydroxy-6-metoxy-1,4-benzoquinol methylase